MFKNLLEIFLVDLYFFRAHVSLYKKPLIKKTTACGNYK